MIDLVVTDLDGTLWDADERIHERTRVALRELERRGTPLLVATGRRPRSAAGALARSGLAPPAVLLDGAMGRDLRDGRVFHEAAFDPEGAAAVLAAFSARGLSPCVYVDLPGIDAVAAPEPSTHPAHLEHLGEWVDCRDLEEVVATERVYAFALAADHPADLAGVAHDAVGAGTATLVEGGLFPGVTITVRPAHTSKWEGVAAFCADRGFDPRRVLALGDGDNDVELLTGAAVACVVRDGCDAALALADHVIAPAGQGGWSAVLELV